jgi:hypothetical protein
LKFGDIVTAVAALAVIDVLLDFVLLVVFIPVNSYWGTDVAGIISYLVASLIVGYVFAVKIQEESRTGAIGRIVVLFSVVVMFAAMALFAVNPYTSTAIKEGLESNFSTSGWTNSDWFGYSFLGIVMLVAFNVIFALVFSFIGLYAGSMLRKPKKT